MSSILSCPKCGRHFIQGVFQKYIGDDKSRVFINGYQLKCANCGIVRNCYTYNPCDLHNKNAVFRENRKVLEIYFYASTDTLRRYHVYPVEGTTIIHSGVDYILRGELAYVAPSK